MQSQQENNIYEAVYEYNNAYYSVTDTTEIHELLKKDLNYLAEYVTKTATAPVLVSISENTDSGQSNFSWTTKSTKLFLHAYAERKDKFRDPKIKKKQLWSEIVEILKQHRYNVDIDILDRKMRNLKRSYKTIKENNQKSSTGRGRVSWEYYDTLEDIFINDRTINPEATLQSSLDTTISSCQEKSIEDQTFPKDNELANTSTANLLTPSTTPLSDSTNLQTISSGADSSSLSSYDTQTTSKNTSVKEKKSSLHNLRKKQLEIEQKRIEAISRMEEYFNKSNKIQEKRNNLIEKLLLSLSSSKESVDECNTDDE